MKAARCRCQTDYGCSVQKVVGITGSRGVIGSYLFEQLQCHEGWRVEPYLGDILDEDAVFVWARETKPDIIFHLAAVVSVDVAFSDQQRAQDVNELGPSQFLRAVRRGTSNRAIRFIYASTCHVYAPMPGAIDETAPIAPHTYYGATKFRGERLLFEEVERKSDVQLVIARIFGVYSARQPSGFLFPNLLSKISGTKGSLSLELAGWNNTRDFLHASQVSQLLIQLADTNFVGTVNVGSGVGRTVREFAEQLFGVDLIVNGGDASVSPTSLVANIGRLRKLLGSSLFDKITEWAPMLD